MNEVMMDRTTVGWILGGFATLVLALTFYWVWSLIEEAWRNKR